MTARNDGSPLRGTLAFTGRLAAMKRAEAFDLVRKHGGTPSRGLTKKTDAPGVGGLGWPLPSDGDAPKKLKQGQIPGCADRERAALSRMARARASPRGNESLFGAANCKPQRAATRDRASARGVRAARPA